jgi:DNA polymerase III subunit delta
MDALPFIAAAAKAKRHPVYALYGDEDFLKRLTRERIVESIVDGEDPAFAVATYPGDKLEFSTLRNELDTLPFLAPCRIVVVENADAFVTENRPALEQYAARPSAVGVLVLEVKTFPETTKLAKAIPDAAKVACKSLPLYRLPAWCVEWAKSRHKKKLATDAAEILVELVGASMGTLDQELAKLAGAVGESPGIGVEDVHRFVGRSQTADVFRILDAIGDGRPGEALSILEDLFAEGEDPMAVLGPLTAQLRKLAAVGRLHLVDGLALGPAMDAAKVPSWEKARMSFQRQLRHLGRRRLEKLTQWLTEINLGLKGGNPLPERVQVERLVVMLARPREEQKV